MFKKYSFLAAYFLLPVVLIAAVYASNPGYYGAAGFVPLVLGGTAYTWLNAQLVLSARPKWIEKYFGLDRFYRFHSLMAVIAILTAFIHKLVAGEGFSESFQTELGDASIVIFIIAAALSLVFLIDTVVNLVKPLAPVRSFFRQLQVGKYGLQVLLHNVNLVAVVLIFVHVMLSYSAHNTLVKLVYIVYFGAAMGFYLYHKVVRRYFLSHPFVVRQVIPESASMTTLVLEPKSGPVFPYLPGQFGFIRIFDPAVTPEEHPFSISSQPLDKKSLSVTIKNLGDWTSKVRDVHTGSKVLLDAPYGRFSPTLFPCKGGIVLMAGGVGITPMLSILRYYFESDRDQKLVLLWGVNKPEELICKQEFAAFQREMKNFVLVPVVAGDPSFPGEKGYIDQKLLTRVLAQNKLDAGKVHYFVCGPARMRQGILGYLKAMKVRKQNIHSENFSL